MKPPLFNNSSQNFKEQDPSASSYGFMKSQILESPLMIRQPRKMLKDKGFISLDHEVIDLDDDEDSNTDPNMAMFMHGNFDTKNKGKGIYHHTDHQVKETLASHSFIPDVEIIENANKVESNFPSSSHNFIDLDNYDLAEDDSWVVYDDIVDVDKYSALQARFDNMDIPTGIEAPIPWLPHGQNGNEINIETSSFLEPRVEPGSVNQLKFQAGLANSRYMPAEIDFLNHFPGNIEPLASFPSQDFHPNKISAASHFRDTFVKPYEVSHTNSIHGIDSVKHQWFDSLKKHHDSNNISIKQSNTMMFRGETSDTSNSVKKQTSFLHNMSHPILPGYTKSAASHFRDNSVKPYEVNHTNSIHGVDSVKHRWFDSLKRRKKHHDLNSPSIKQPNTMMFRGETSDTSNSVKKQTSLHNMPHPDFPGYMDFVNYLDVGQYMPHFPVESAQMKTKKPFFAPHMASSLQFLPFPGTHGEVDISSVQGAAQNPVDLAPGGSTSATFSPMDLINLWENFERFKQFDSVDDHSDHYYAKHGFSMNQAPKKWTKKIQEEWKILEKDLPETIFVRVYESRMDLMRAVIIGAQGTPYHDGLFFFDIFFPNGYPDEPPKVHYHSGGLRLNPNLYNCGKVCLSLLNTWSGRGNEKWIPGMSTMLQVLVSIQALILNSKPYFNEPGYASSNGSAAGENKSQRYNEETFLLSIKTMTYSIRRPPKHYGDFVRGHFFKKAHDILVACKAYTDGTQVGSEVKGEARDLNVGNKSSKGFQNSLNSLLSQLVDAFKNIGVSDCEKFVSTPVPAHSKCKIVTRSRHGK